MLHKLWSMENDCVRLQERLITMKHIGMFLSLMYFVIQTEACPQCLDVAIIVDSSSELPEAAWNDSVVPFLQSFASEPMWNIGPQAFQFAVVKYAKFVEKRIRWGEAETGSRENLTAAIDALRYIGEGNTEKVRQAFEVTRTLLLPTNNRPECSDVCIVMIAGSLTLSQGFRQEVELFQQACGKVIAIGMTPFADPAALSTISTYNQAPLQLSTGLNPSLPDLFDEAKMAVCRTLFCPACADILVIADSSADVTINWDSEVKAFLRLFAKSSEWDISLADMQVALISYGKFITKHWNWGSVETSNSAALDAALDAVQFKGDGTSPRVREALEKASGFVLGGAGDRPQCENYCVVTIAGSTPMPIGFKAVIDNFRGRCDKIYGVGLTQNADIEFLSYLTRDMNNMQIGDFSTTLFQSSIVDIFRPVEEFLCPAVAMAAEG